MGLFAVELRLLCLWLGLFNNNSRLLLRLQGIAELVVK